MRITENETKEPEYIWVDGFKGTHSDLRCRDFQYELNQEYEIDGDPRICGNGFHFCKELKHVFSHYDYDFSNRFFKVKALVNKNDWEKFGDKYVAKKIILVEELELTYEKLMEMGKLQRNSIYNEYTYIYMPKDLFDLQKENQNKNVVLQWYIDKMEEIGHSAAFSMIFIENLRHNWGDLVASYIRAKALFDEGLSKDMRAYLLLQQKTEAEKRRAEYYAKPLYRF